MKLHDNKKLHEILKIYQWTDEFIGTAPVSVNARSNFGGLPIHIAAVRGNIDEIDTLLSHGALINAKGEHGYTPLHESVEQGHTAAVKLLLERGADTTARNDDNLTPCDLAKLTHQQEILLLLQKHKKE